MTDQQIIALGGGFSIESARLLDDYILQACGKDNPRICFVPTASGDADSYNVMFYRRFSAARCRPTDLSLFSRTVTDLEDFACSQDIIFVGGGNTANLLAVWRAHGFDVALKAALQAGVLLTGTSAGSLCWFESGVTDSFGPVLQPLECLGFLPDSNCPHYDSESQRRPTYHRLVQAGLPAGYAADDAAGLHFVNGRLERVVACRPEARAYRVELQGNAVIETVLDARYPPPGTRTRLRAS